jgi:DNA polymerase III delta prime subunit
MAEVLWVEKYRPKTIEECILPASLKKTFRDFVQAEKIPNLLLCGSAGTGKTTVARAMLDECDYDYIMINGSLDLNVDALRNDIATFASTVSFNNKRKYVILDEADYMNVKWSQPALRNFMEEFSSNCGFIFTCNYKNRIIEPLHSRCSVVEFMIPKEEKPKLARDFMKRLEHILTTEGVGYERKPLAELIMKHMPDWRRILNELQRYSIVGDIDENILKDFNRDSINELIEVIKKKDFEGIRKWVHYNSDIESTTIYRLLYEYAMKLDDGPSKPMMLLILAKYQYQHAFVADGEINLVACIVEIMADCDL